MIYKRFYISIIIQVILLSITPLLFLYVRSKMYMLVTTYSLVALWIIQIIYLIYYINKTNRDLSKFFNAFQYQDSTLVFNQQKEDKAFRNIHKSFNQIIHAFGKVKIEKEKDFVFFQHTIQLVGIGLLAFDGMGNVRLCNKAFKDLFRLDDFQNISELSCLENGFPDFLVQLKTEKQNLQNYLIENRLLKLAIKAVDFRLENESMKLISFQDIKSEIDKGEMEAMNKLIRVFTHEIINSVSPISLLSSSLIDLYERNDVRDSQSSMSEEVISNSLLGLKTIRKRSKGLISFVDEYKNLTQLPNARFELFSVVKLFEHIEMLFREECQLEGIEFTVSVNDEAQELIADEKLITQVLINLVRNSIHALEGMAFKQIKLSVDESNPVSCIKIMDNGVGIPDDIMNNIFTPFFTTKEKGSGIGLNLARQIMRLHDGSISVTSKPQNKTEFILQF
ncbi:HAMP domain-containing histidine kinase [Ancylomarina salipaludis]|uniref:histidine kinase n=1 Tax=Ancylomarina salipaludis TaxID=2501299 RepID=A0A4Q1JK93_9BACT|nr:sensor histidine kinase [Ancylomarina salipaludis]RXQ90388.1 HAMP domain-containing histidine kinase [Ancylomarina salipaludis]